MKLYEEIKRKKDEITWSYEKLSNETIEIIMEKEHLFLEMKVKIEKKEDEIKILNNNLLILDLPQNEIKFKLRQFMLENEELSEKIKNLLTIIEENDNEYAFKLDEYKKKFDKNLDDRYREMIQHYSINDNYENYSHSIEKLKVFFFFILTKKI